MRNILFFLIIIILSSCARLFFGLREFPKLTFEKQKEFMLKSGIESNNLFVFDSICIDLLHHPKYLLDSLSLSDSSVSLPQFRVFNSSGKLIGGWQQCFGSRDFHGVFKKFPPTVKENRYIVFNKSSRIDDFINCIDSESERNNFNDKYEYYIVVFWARTLGVFNKKMLQDFSTYIKNHEEKLDDTAIIYFNLDGYLN